MNQAPAKEFTVALFDDDSYRRLVDSIRDYAIFMLAHELRNPLAPIRNAVAIMSVLRDTSPQIAWCRDVIERHAMHLTRLVDDLLDVSRITRGVLRMQGTPMNLNEAIHVAPARSIISSTCSRRASAPSTAPRVGWASALRWRGASSRFTAAR